MQNTYKYIIPEYDKVRLEPGNDTMNIRLNDDTYNEVRSINAFIQNGVTYIAIHEKRQESINIYEYALRKLVRKISLKNCFPDHQLYKTSVFVKNFDSIFITNKTSLHLIDSTGIVKGTWSFLKDPPLSWGILENDNPVIFNGNKIYTALRPNMDESSLRALGKWQVLYEFNLQNGDSTKLHCYLPLAFQRKLYGYRLLRSSFCFNDDGDFVISFAGDTCIYETDLRDHHYSYYAKSKFHNHLVQPLKSGEASGNKAFEKYLTSDSYYSIYFDPFRKRYLRIARQAISKEDYRAKKWTRQQSLIIFDENFKIIGESVIDSNIWLGSIFFTPDGSIYAQTNAGDEYTLHFIRLLYKE